MTAEETLTFDVVIVGAGPAGLATALSLLASETPPSVCILEKASRVGGHTISGAVVAPEVLRRLEEQGVELPETTPVREESWHYLTRDRELPLPIPGNHAGHRLLSLGRLCRAMARRAEGLGAMILPGFAAREWLREGAGVAGVVADATAIRGRVVVLAEGCRGHLTRQAIERFRLDRNRCPPTYALGLKETWSVPETRSGELLHTLGHPFSLRQAGGGFLHSSAPGRLSLGLLFPLDYANPWLDPYRAFLRWKEHPWLRQRWAGGELLAFGARTLTMGGIQSLPELVFPGGLLVGDAAGFLDPVRVRGIAQALASGELAGRFLNRFLASGHEASPAHLAAYQEAVLASEFVRALSAVRNLRPGVRALGAGGMVVAAWEGLLRGHSPWTWRWRQDDAQRLAPAARFPAPPGAGEPERERERERALHHAALAYPAGAGHLRHTPAPSPDPYALPETRFCPAGVFRAYEGAQALVRDERCLHCKTCDIKAPASRIRWTPPPGGGGPDYREM